MTVKKGSSVFDEDIIEKCLVDYLPSNETSMFQSKLLLTMEKDSESGVFEVKEKHFFMYFKKISTSRIRIDAFDMADKGTKLLRLLWRMV